MKKKVRAKIGKAEKKDARKDFSYKKFISIFSVAFLFALFIAWAFFSSGADIFNSVFMAPAPTPSSTPAPLGIHKTTCGSSQKAAAETDNRCPGLEWGQYFPKDSDDGIRMALKGCLNYYKAEECRDPSAIPIKSFPDYCTSKTILQEGRIIPYAGGSCMESGFSAIDCDARCKELFSKDYIGRCIGDELEACYPNGPKRAIAYCRCILSPSSPMPPPRT